MPSRSVNAMLDFLSPVSVIPGMGEKRLSALNESGIETLGDLLYCFPTRYIDRSLIIPIGQLEEHLDTTCTVKGTVNIIHIEHGRRERLRVQICDESGSMELLWFQGVQFFRKSIQKEAALLVTGKVDRYGHFQMIHPIIETIKSNEPVQFKIFPFYSITNAMKEAGLQQKLFFKAIIWVLNNLKHYPQVLPIKIESKKKFPPLQKCLMEIHTPSSLESLDYFRARIKFEELYKLAITLRLSKKKFSLPGRVLHPGLLPDRFKKNLPFELTPDQEMAIEVLFQDAKSSRRMHRLLQGDVGSGKTLVAFFSLLPALNEGLQVAWMTPTDILASQTFELISSWLKPLGFTTSILKSGLPSQQRQSIVIGLQNGHVHCIIGTHALLQPTIKFQALGMIVIDEQHKFGAQQRLTMQEKDPSSDFLLMSATPIPQTLAQTLYGDLDIVTICKPPAGRSAISTHIVPHPKRHDMERFVLNEIKNGFQAYCIVPRITHNNNNDDDENDKLKIRDLESTFNVLTKGPFSSVPVANLHGKLSSDEKEKVMNQFVSGSIKLLLATSVIEVGIDVPNATIIIIENAEMFGLAQLHQLRGRVGRGQKKSFCFLLLSECADTSAKERLSLFCKSNDGFKIADLDLKLRGPGEIIGFKQSGWDELKFADIINDAYLFKEIQLDLAISMNS